MSRETMEWLNNNVLRGFTDKRGNAWHRDLSLVAGGLDNHYAGAIPAEDILARLFSWEAEERKVYVADDSGIPVLDPSRKAIVRPDSGAILGMHSEGYVRHSYSEWLIKHLSALVGGEAEFANAGLLSGGAVAWVQIEMPENIDTPEGVTFRPFVMATTSFDGSIASLFKPGVTDVVCDNTRAAALAESTPTYRVKHTRKSAFNLATAAQTIETLHLIGDNMMAEVARLCAIDVTDAHWAQFVTAHVGLSDDKADKMSGRSVTMAEAKRAALTGLYRTDIRGRYGMGRGSGRQHVQPTPVDRPQRQP
jgi:phage/plasmid-like protein (TIGR03299 family)